MVTKELPIPPAALADRSVELMRVWSATQRLHCVLNIGMWESRGLDERAAWGIVLADTVHHIANAHASEYGYDPQESVAIIRRAFEAEMDHPTSDRLGEFLKVRQEEP
jgi:hypothetical protein